MKTTMTKKDFVIWAIAILLFMPCLLVLNESNTIVPNLIGFAYIGLLFLAGRTNVGRLFFKRLMRIEEKLFKA